MTREEHYKAAEAEIAEAEELYARGDEALAVTRLRFAEVHAKLAQTPPHLVITPGRTASERA